MSCTQDSAGISGGVFDAFISFLEEDESISQLGFSRGADYQIQNNIQLNIKRLGLHMLNSILLAWLKSRIMAIVKLVLKLINVSHFKIPELGAGSRIENNIMKQLDSDATMRHPSRGHS